jgi:hypothetical protein
MKKLYLVAPGVTEINGVPVPSNRRVSLTDAEALYDLGHGRLTPAPPRETTRRKAPK